MYDDYSLHVAQFKALFQGLVLRPGIIGPYSFNLGLKGIYNPSLAKRFLKDRTQ